MGENLCPRYFQYLLILHPDPLEMGSKCSDYFGPPCPALTRRLSDGSSAASRCLIEIGAKLLQAGHLIACETEIQAVRMLDESLDEVLLRESHRAPGPALLRQEELRYHQR